MIDLTTYPDFATINVPSTNRKPQSVRQFTLLGFPPAPGDNARVVEFAYISTEIKRALIEKGWRFVPRQGWIGIEGGDK